MNWDLILQIIAISLGFLVQTIFGFAAPMTAYPILLMQMTVPEAVALVSIFTPLFSVLQLKKNWRLIDRKTIKEMVIGLLIGLVIGVIVLKYANPLILKKLLGVFILLFVVYSFLQKKKIKAFRRLGQVFGFIGGFFSGLFVTGGPPVVAYIFNKLNKPEQIRATIIGALAIINFARLPLLIGNQILTKATLVDALYILPFFLLSLFLGQKIFARVKSQHFKKALLIVLGLAALKLLI